MRLKAAWAAVAAMVAAGVVIPMTGALSAAPDSRQALPPVRAATCAGGTHGRDTPTANVTAADSYGAPLAADPVLTPAQTAVITVRGFAAGADVAIRLANATATTHRNASTSGALSIAYPVSALANGAYRLLFQGDFAGSHAPAGTGDLGVSVPEIGIFPFSVDCADQPPFAMKLMLKAKPARITAGKPTKITGYATGPLSSAKLRIPLQLWASIAGGRWKRIATKTPAANGVDTFTLTPPFTTRYQLRFAGGTVNGTTYAAAKSAAIVVAVVAKASFSAPKTFTHGRRTKVTITVTPKLKGRIVFLQIDRKNMVKARTNAKGKVVVNLVLTKIGTHKLRIYVPTSKRNTKTTSKTLTVKVR
ncbi:MAG TPA: hypothetical protein VGL26_10660 [Jatrophihabitans sp.]|jgi:hypothetical protein